MRSRGPSEGRPGKNCSARCDAARRLGLVSLPAINPIAIRAIQALGSKQHFIEYARLSHDEKIQALVARWDRLSPSDRRALSISDLCAATGLRFSKLLGAVTAQAFDQNTDVSSLIAAVNQPRVVKAAVRSALCLGPAGVRDRHMLLSHSNFLPVPKSATTIFGVQQQISATHALKGGEATSLPSFSADIIAFNAAQRGLRLSKSPAIENQGALNRATSTVDPNTGENTGDHGKQLGDIGG
jgi:hypothetical protein